MKYFVVLLFVPITLIAQLNKAKAYLFPGQGSDYRIFSEIKLDSNYQRIYVSYPLPEKGTTLPEFAKQIAKQIDTSGDYIFIGVSLGGMICTELADIYHPQKTIIISSAKCRSELPTRYRFQKNFPLNKIVPAKVIKSGALILQPLVEPDRKKNDTTFKAMLLSKNPKYLKRTVDMIINWKREKYSPNIIHIHGDNDHTLPLKNIQAQYVINAGSHMMALTRGKEINELLLKVLKPSSAK